jgi:hypothetical protein
MRISIADQLDSIFDIPKDGSNIKEEADESQETSYAAVINDKEVETFEQKASKLHKALAKDAPPHNVEYISKEDSNGKEQQTQQAQKIEPQKAAASRSEASFEKILTQAIRPNEPVSVEVLPVVQKQTVDNQTADVCEDDGDENTQRSSVSEEVSQLEVANQKPDNQGWLLTSPSPMYNHFYTQKGMLIMSITRTGSQLPIDQMLAELKSSYVNTNVELSDLQGMYDKLTQIQNYLDRVVQIKILATGQCSATKRGVELLRGVLAKVCYEKPAARQDGVNYDHMRDLEMYACRVESLEQSAKDVYHNLLEAKEILSRKISVAIELFKQQHMSDNIEKTYNNLPGNVKSAIQTAERVENKSVTQKDGFDKLEIQEVVQNKIKIEKTPMKKSGQTDWFD